MEASARTLEEAQDMIISQFNNARDAIRARLSEAAEECTTHVYGLPTNKPEVVKNRTLINMGALERSEPGDQGRPIFQRQFLPHREPGNILKNRSDNLRSMFVTSLLSHPKPEHRLSENEAREKATALTREVLRSERHIHNHPKRRPRDLELDLLSTSAHTERSLDS